MEPTHKVSITSFAGLLSLALLFGPPLEAAAPPPGPATAQPADASPFGNINPIWLNLYVMTGSPSLGKSVGGLNNSPSQTSLDLELANPVGKVTSIGYFLPFLNLKISSADAQTVASTPAQGSTPAAPASQNTTEAEHSRIEVGLRYLWWVGGTGASGIHDSAIGLQASVLRTSYGEQVQTLAAVGTGTLTTPDSSGTVEQTSYRAAIRYEANPDIVKNPSMAGSFLECGYLHDPFFAVKADRLFLRGRLQTNLNATSHVFMQLQFITGKGQQDQYGFFVGYQIRLADFFQIITGKKTSQSFLPGP
jgi:hypothetical protein